MRNGEASHRIVMQQRSRALVPRSVAVQTPGTGVESNCRCCDGTFALSGPAICTVALA